MVRADDNIVFLFQGWSHRESYRSQKIRGGLRWNIDTGVCGVTDHNSTCTERSQHYTGKCVRDSFLCLESSWTISAQVEEKGIDRLLPTKPKAPMHLVDAIKA